MLASKMVWLGFFPTSFAMTGNRTHFSSVAPHVSVLNPGCFTDRATAAAASLRHRGPGKNKQLMLELILFSPSIFRLAHHETEINSVPFVDVSPVLLIFYRSCKKTGRKKTCFDRNQSLQQNFIRFIGPRQNLLTESFFAALLFLSSCDLKKSFEQLVH